MHRFILFLAFCAGLVCAASAFANVGSTSSSVTTVDPNAPSSDVQQQSSGFVAANQQMQNAATNGIVLPNGSVGSAQSGSTGPGGTGAKGAQPGQSGSSNANTQGGEKDEHGRDAEPTAPATPPPPPPTYESKMRPLSRTADDAPPPPPTAAPTPVQRQASPKPPVTMAKPPAFNPKPGPATDAAQAPKNAPEPGPVTTADPGGGRGAAPDGYTFWFGLLIAAALFALATVTYLRLQRGELPR